MSALTPLQQLVRAVIKECERQGRFLETPPEPDRMGEQEPADAARDEEEPQPAS